MSRPTLYTNSFQSQWPMDANEIESPAGCSHCKLRMDPRDGWSVTALVTALSWSFKRIKIKFFCVCWLDMSVLKSNIRIRDDSVRYADLHPACQSISAETQKCAIKRQPIECQELRKENKRFASFSRQCLKHHCVHLRKILVLRWWRSWLFRTLACHLL